MTPTRESQAESALYYRALCSLSHVGLDTALLKVAVGLCTLANARVMKKPHDMTQMRGSKSHLNLQEI